MKLAAVALTILLQATVQASSVSLEAWQKAVQLDRLDQITSMIDQGADVNLGSQSGKTALMAAAKRGDRQLSRRLLNEGANVNAANEKGGTVLMYAMLSNDPEVLSMVLDKGASLDLLTVTGWSALMIGCAKGYTQLVDLLVKRGADINQADIYGWTPLIRATNQGHVQTVTRLLESQGLKLSARDEAGKTALHHAALQGYPDIAELLLDAGADARSEDLEGRRPADLADQAGHARLAEKLKTAGG